MNPLLHVISAIATMKTQRVPGQKVIGDGIGLNDGFVSGRRGAANRLSSRPSQVAEQAAEQDAQHQTGKAEQKQQA